MVKNTNTSTNSDKNTTHEVPKPHREPSLPPGHSGLYSSSCNLPGVDIERVSNPEKDKIEPRPQPSILLNRLQIVVEKVQLSGGEIRLTVNLDVVDNPPP